MDENIGYNGAYSGAEIDAAIGAVKNKETTWDGKQDKLTGVQGQVVGFDDEGDAVAMPAPDTGVTTFNGRTGAVTPQAGDYTAAMVGARGDDWTPTADDVGAIPAPEGGTAGQVLTKTVDGEAWQDAPSGLPDGGTEGQMLYKSAEGAEWGDKPVMMVNITPSSDNPGMMVADKTFSEVTEAAQNGFTVYAKVSYQSVIVVLPLSMQRKQTLGFTALIENILFAVTITEQDVYFASMKLGATRIEFVPGSGIASDNVQDAIEEVQSNIPTDYIPTSEKGANSGVATLGADGVLTESQRPTYTASDVGAITNPSGGSDGQMLYKTASGVVWGDKPVMYVNITSDDSSGYVADKTASEIYEAYSNGNAIFAITGLTIVGLYNISASGGTYSATFLTTYNTTVYIVSVVESSGNSYVNISSSPISPDAVNVDFTPASTLTSTNVQDAIAEVQGNVDAAKPVLRTATLTTSGWSSNSQTVTVNGIIADSASQSVDVVPADRNSAKAWGDAGVWCDSQGANTLTFSCESVPTANITLNIRFQGART